jgi:ABC-type glycerol-3-phosphate transport system substrate-binding protein
MNGRTVVFQMIQSNATDAGPKDKHVERYKAKIAAVEKQYNCKIVVSASNNETMGDTSVKNSVIAGKPKVDIWNQNGFTMEFLPHYIAGLIQPLDPLKCFNFSDKAKYEGQAAGSAESMIINGIHFGVMSSGGSNGITGFQNDQMMFYRTDVLQKSGITPDMMPVALAEKGQWTWDNFAKDCQKVRAAGNIPLQDNAGSGNGINQNNLYAEMCYTFGTDFVKQDASTRTVTFNGGSAAALQALDLYTSFVKNRTIDAPAPNVHEDMSSSDKIAFSPVCTYMAKWLYPRWGTEVSKANWGIVYLPKVKASDSYTAIADALQGGQCISYGVKQPADAATVLQALTPLDTENNAMKAEVMMDFELWVNPNNAKDILKILNEINDIAFTSAQKWEIDGLANGCGVSNDWLAHVQKIATGQENAGTVIAANTGKYNDTLKKLYVIR